MQNSSCSPSTPCTHRLDPVLSCIFSYCIHYEGKCLWLILFSLQRAMIHQQGYEFFSVQEVPRLKIRKWKTTLSLKLESQDIPTWHRPNLEGLYDTFLLCGDAKHRRNLYTCTAEKISVAAVHISLWRERGGGSRCFGAQIGSFGQHTKFSVSVRVGSNEQCPLVHSQQPAAAQLWASSVVWRPLSSWDWGFLLLRLAVLQASSKTLYPISQDFIMN